MAKGVPVEYTVAACRDIRKFVTIQKVNGGGVKMWGEGPRKGARVMDMVGTLQANGWAKEGRKWRKGDSLADAVAIVGAGPKLLERDVDVKSVYFEVAGRLRLENRVLFPQFDKSLSQERPGAER